MSRRRSGPRAQLPGLVPLVVFVVTRAYLLALARAAPLLLTPLHRYPTYLPRTDPLARVWPWAGPWFRFDAHWYVGVAEHGYRYGSSHGTNTNFFPLYPALIRIVQPVTAGSPWLAAWVVSNVSFLVALVVLWEWALARWDRDVALRVILLIACFPFAFFFAAPYAESVFLACAVCAFWLADSDHWVAATVAAGFAALSRPVGAALIAGLLVLALSKGNKQAAATSLLASIPLLAFVAYLWALTGHSFAVTVYHSGGWVPPHGGLLPTVESQFHTYLSPFDRIDAIVAALFLLSSIAVWRRIDPGYAVYVVLGVGLPLVHGLVSMERYVTVLFPVPAAWALWRAPAGQAAIFAISILLLTVSTCMFVTGYSIF